MPYSNGQFTAIANSWNPAVPATTISSADFNSQLSDWETAWSTCILKDGTQTLTANIPFSGFKATGVNTNSGSASRSEWVSGATYQDGAPLHAGTTAGTSTAYTATLSPAITAYAAGQRFTVKTNAACGASPTINFNSVGAKKIYRNASGTATQPAADDIPNNFEMDLLYDTALDGGAGGFWLLDQSYPNQANSYTKIQKWAKGADVASANALALGDDGNYFDITGTTAITSIGTKGVGTVVKLHFDAALTLTHNATDLILPGGANITTAAGDEAEFVEYASGDWRCTNYLKASGNPIAYSIGSWTPVLTFATPGTLSVAYSTQIGTYTKIGDLVFLKGTITTSSFTRGTAAGDLQITGLPFTSETSSGNPAIGNCSFGGITKANYTQVNAFIGNATTTMLLVIAGSAQSNTTVQAGDVPSGGTVQLQIGIVYKAA